MSEAPVTQAQALEQELMELERRARQLEQELGNQYNLADPVEKREYHNHVWTILFRNEELWQAVKGYAARLEDYTDALVRVEVEYYDSTLYLRLLLYKKYAEISESCSHAGSEEEFEACFEEAFEEVDSECVTDVDLSLKIRSELEVKSWKVACDGDYCVCGNEFEMIIRGSSPSETVSLLRLYYPRVVEIVESLMPLA